MSKSVREIIWERCEGDDYKTDEILVFLRGMVEGLRMKMITTSADKMRDIEIYNSGIDKVLKLLE